MILWLVLGGCVYFVEHYIFNTDKLVHATHMREAISIDLERKFRGRERVKSKYIDNAMKEAKLMHLYKEVMSLKLVWFGIVPSKLCDEPRIKVANRIIQAGRPSRYGGFGFAIDIDSAFDLYREQHGPFVVRMLPVEVPCCPSGWSSVFCCAFLDSLDCINLATFSESVYPASSWHFWVLIFHGTVCVFWFLINVTTRHLKELKHLNFALGCLWVTNAYCRQRTGVRIVYEHHILMDHIFLDKTNL